MKVNKKNAESVLKNLKNLHQWTVETNDFNAYEFAKEYDFPHIQIVVMKKGGIIQTTGKGRKAKTYWTSIAPTLEMAFEVIRRVNRYQKEAYHKSKEKKQQEEETQKMFEQPEVTQTTTTRTLELNPKKTVTATGTLPKTKKVDTETVKDVMNMIDAAARRQYIHRLVKKEIWILGIFKISIKYTYKINTSQI